MISEPAAEVHRGAAVYDRSIFVDALNGSALVPPVIASLRSAGVSAINLTAVRIGATPAQMLEDLAATIETVAANDGRLRLVRAPEDIVHAKQERRTGIILGMQDAEPLGRDLFMLRVLHAIGLRIIQLTHNRRNLLGTGCAEADDGLSQFGRRFVAEMNRLGMIVDASHCGARTTLDAIECSAVPILCTHSNPATVSASLRNKSDDIIRRLAARGGAIGIAVWSPIVYRGDGRQPGLADVLDCIDHALDLVGPEHVMIGTDICEYAVSGPEEWDRIYGPGGQYPAVTGGLGDWYGFETVNAAGIETIDRSMRLAEGMADRGHGDGVIAQVLGLTFLRVFRAVAAAGAPAAA